MSTTPVIHWIASCMSSGAVKSARVAADRGTTDGAQ